MHTSHTHTHAHSSRCRTRNAWAEGCARPRRGSTRTGPPRDLAEVLKTRHAHKLAFTCRARVFWPRCTAAAAPHAHTHALHPQPCEMRREPSTVQIKTKQAKRVSPHMASSISLLARLDHCCCAPSTLRSPLANARSRMRCERALERATQRCGMPLQATAMEGFKHCKHCEQRVPRLKPRKTL